MSELIHALAAPSPSPEPVADLTAWWARHRALPGTDPLARAVLGGLYADRLGYAFGSGYVEALRALVPCDPSVPRSLAVTEDGPPTPRSIATTLSDGRLDGVKSFATLGPIAEEFLVAARRGTHEDGRPDITVVRVPRARDGVTVEAGPSTGFTPEVTHARLVLRGVPVGPGEVLEGDGYVRYLKPFRTVEDIHVHAATLGYLLRCARAFGWDVADALGAQVLALGALAAADPLDPPTHLALASVLDVSRALIDRLDADDLWGRADAVTRERWERDRALLKVAGRVRAERLERARTATDAARS